jgi:hypothetical protein
MPDGKTMYVTGSVAGLEISADGHISTLTAMDLSQSGRLSQKGMCDFCSLKLKWQK